MNTTGSERSVQDYLDGLIQRSEIPGIQYLVVDEQDIRFEYYGGRCNIGADLPVTPETTFMVSSSTKPLTAVAILQLVEWGQALETTLGWHRGRLAETPYYGKPGGGPGFRSNIRVYPEKRLATAWFINETGVSEGSINNFTDTLDRHFLAL